jgi:hypothetical protein
MVAALAEAATAILAGKISLAGQMLLRNSKIH